MDKTDLLLGSLSLATFVRLIGVLAPAVSSWSWGLASFGAAGNLFCIAWFIVARPDRELAFLSFCSLLCLAIGLLLGGER